MASERTAPTPPKPGPLSQLRDELRLVEEEIERARHAAQELRSLIGGRSEGATDLGDRSAAISQAEQQEELLGILTTRREQVQERTRAYCRSRR